MTGWITYTTADEFATDAAFRAWVVSGQYNQPEHTHARFLAGHAHLLPLASQAADLIRVTAVPTEPLSARELTAQIETTWGKIRRVEEKDDVPVIPMNRVWFWQAAAAVILLVGGLGWWISRPADSPNQPLVATWQAVTNQQTTNTPVNLADGSVVWLSPGSTLRYPTRFDTNRRQVTLNGEAFFEVHKNTRQPFFVKTSQVITRVVGTSFLIRMLPKNGGTVVQVRTGKVLVYRNSARTTKEEPVSLQANEELRVTGSQQPPVTHRVQQPSALSERLNEQPFEFADVPVSQVLNALAQAYDIPIDYDPAAFRDCQITTALSDEPLTEKLAILAETIGPGTRAELTGNRIKITGPGCH